MESKYKPQSVWFYIQVFCMLLLLLETPIYLGVEMGVIEDIKSGMDVVNSFLR